MVKTVCTIAYQDESPNTKEFTVSSHETDAVRKYYSRSLVELRIGDNLIGVFNSDDLITAIDNCSNVGRSVRRGMYRSFEDAEES